LLCIVFFSLATWNVGLTQTPTTTTQFTAGQSFNLDLGSSVNVKSVVILLKQGAFNVTVSSGSPGNWQNAPANDAWPYSNNQWSEDYYKWREVSVGQTTQYLKFNFSQAGYDTNIAEVAVISTDDQQVQIQSITNAGTGSPNLQDMVDEQGMVQYPADYMSNTYFDEIYFVRTAEQYLNLQYPYEWTHPPLGKLIQAAGIAVMGFDPFGWRMMGVIFATLMIALAYLIGKELLGTWIGGFTTAFLVTFDFMHFTMARMGTADTYVVFFSLASQLFFLIYLKGVLKDSWKTSVIPLFLSVLFFALGFSTKWVVLYGFVGELALLVTLRLSEVVKLKGNLSAKVYAFLDRPYSAVVAFILIAIGVYFLTYIPDMIIGRSFTDVLSLQGSMFEYHSRLTATHAFSSPWYSWPLLFDPINGNVHVPLYLESASVFENRSTIVLMGNPVIWWIGFAAIVIVSAVIVNHVYSKKFTLRDHLPEVFLAVLFFFQWLPYVLISRVVFIYHFYVNMPFLCLASAFFISKYWRRKRVKILSVAFFVLVIAMFVLFYPAISGSPASPSTIDSLKWIRSWVF
jgi:dolichyl-phosphate-mannose--protein O-mannosyl transferase